MIFSELCRSFSRSFRAKNIINGCYKGRRAGLLDESASLSFYSSLNRSDPKLGFLRSYLASIGAQKKDYLSDTSKYVYASPRFCRFFSGETSENFCSKEKKFSKSDQQESESNESKSNTEDQGNAQEAFMKQYRNILTPLLVIGLVLLSFSFFSREKQQISFQEFKDKLLKPGLVDHVEISHRYFNRSIAKVYVKNSPQDQRRGRHSGQYKYYLTIEDTVSFEKKLSEVQQEMVFALYVFHYFPYARTLNTRLNAAPKKAKGQADAVVGPPAQPISFQEFKDKLLAGQVDHVEFVYQTLLPPLAKVYVRSSPRDQTSSDTLQGTASNAPLKYRSGEYKYYIREFDYPLSFRENMSKLKEEMGDLYYDTFCSVTVDHTTGWLLLPLSLFLSMESKRPRLGKDQISKVVKNAKNKVHFKDVAG